jgi:AraC-like DNA-binding protein
LAAGVLTGARGEDDFEARPGEIVFLDLTEPYAMSFRDGFDAFSVVISHDELGLSESVIRRGTRNISTSPMHGLVRQHVARVCTALPSLTGDPGARVLGDVTVDLVRALLSSAGDVTRISSEVMRESLPLRVEQYIVQHLTDPELSPERIAAVHHISVRQLYYLWSNHDCTLGNWITLQRLEGACREIAGVHSGRRSIAAVSRRWGFADPTHFSRRFKERYGMTPSDWRHISESVATPSAEAMEDSRWRSRGRDASLWQFRVPKDRSVRRGPGLLAVATAPGTPWVISCRWRTCTISPRTKDDGRGSDGRTASSNMLGQHDLVLTVQSLHTRGCRSLLRLQGAVLTVQSRYRPIHRGRRPT